MHFLLSNHPSQQLAALAGMLFLQHSSSTAVASAQQTNHHLRRNLPHSISAPQNRNSLQSLCFDLSNKRHGQFGSRTVQISQHNAQWLLDYTEVSKGPCTNMEQLLNAREMKEVTYCKQVVRKEYEIKAPRFLENYLYEIGAGRGACMDADGGDEIESLSGRVNNNNNNNNKSKRNDDTNMVTLCFDLEEYGPQTIDVSKKSAKWFLNNDNDSNIRNKNDDTVQRGACNNNNSNSEKLSRQETELLTYCKHFGSPQNGYEYEIEGPRFLSDYLRNIKGVERGGCRNDATNVSGKVDCNYVGDVFDVDMIVDNDSSKKDGNNDSSEGGKDGPRPNVGKKPDKPRPNAGRQSKDEKDVDEEDGAEDYTCLCQQPNKVMSSIKEQGNRSSSKSRKKKDRPSSSSKSKKIGKKKQNKPKPKSSRSKNKPKPEPKKSFESESSQDESKIQEKLDELPSSKDEKEEEEPEEKKEDSKCDNCICKGVPHSGFVQEPGTSCKKFVQCYDGCVSQHLSCGGGLIFDYNLQVCNWEMLGAFCGPDPDCTSDER